MHLGGNVNIYRIYTRLHTPLTYFLPQRLSGSQAGAGRHKPAVSQLPLVQIMGTDPIHKQVRIIAQLLIEKQTQREREREKKMYECETGEKRKNNNNNKSKSIDGVINMDPE